MLLEARGPHWRSELRKLYCYVHTASFRDVQGSPPNRELYLFHGGNTGSNPVGDANKIKKFRETAALLQTYEDQLHTKPRRVVIHKIFAIHRRRARRLRRSFGRHRAVWFGDDCAPRHLLPSSRKQAGFARNDIAFRGTERPSFYDWLYSVPSLLSGVQNSAGSGSRRELVLSNVPRCRS